MNESNNDLKNAEEFVKKLYQLRIKTVNANNSPAKVTLDLLEKYKIIYGSWNGKIDLFITSEDNIPKDIECRFIISEKEVDHIDFQRSKIQLFDEFNCHLYERKDLKKVLFISPFSENNAVFYFRVELPAFKLWENYIDIHSVVSSREDFDAYDIIVFHRHAPNQDTSMKLAKDKGKKIIYDTDDLDLFIPGTNPHFKEYSSKDNQDCIKNQLLMADLITVATDPLKKELEQFTDIRIEVLKNKVDLSLWNVSKEERKQIVVGWLGGLSHYYDMELASAPIIRAIRSTNSKLLLCGYNKAPNITILKDGKLVSTTRDKESVWDKMIKIYKDLGDKLELEIPMKVKEYQTLFSKFDIVIAPLEDNRFTRCKSELKVIEAGAAGLPIICSDVESYRLVIKHGENGFLVKPKEFEKYLKLLINDKDLRHKLGNNLRKVVEAQYDANNQHDRYKLYTELYK